MSPILLETYPTNETGIPIGVTLRLVFDKPIDVKAARNYLVLYGRDYDRRDGPGAAVWLDKTGVNPFYLKSPGLKGIVPVDITGQVVDATTLEAVDLELTAGTDFTTDYKYCVYIKPQNSLVAEVEYKLQIVGDPDETGTGIGSQTVWAAQADPGNASETGAVISGGSYTSNAADVLNIKITTAGNIGTAKYKYWWTSEGESSARTRKLTHGKFYVLDRGAEVRFSGTDFAVGDSWTINCDPIERLAESYTIVFTTNDGTYSVAPESPSSGAQQSPPISVIPPLPGQIIEDVLMLVKMTPMDSDYNIDVDTKTIVLEFNYDLDPDTVTDDTVDITMLPIDGIYNLQGKVTPISKSLQVVGNKIIITI